MISGDSAAVKKMAPSSRGETIQKIPEFSRNALVQKPLMGVRLCRHVEKRTILKILMGSRLCSWSAWSVFRNVCLSVPFFPTQCGFSGNRHGASSWTTRFSPRTKILKMTDFLKREMVATLTIDFIFNMARTYAKVNSSYFPSCVFLGLSARGFFSYLEVCPAHVCLVVWLCDLSRSCPPFLHQPLEALVFSGWFFCTHRMLGDRFCYRRDFTALAGDTTSENIARAFTRRDMTPADALTHAPRQAITPKCFRAISVSADFFPGLHKIESRASWSSLCPRCCICRGTHSKSGVRQVAFLWACIWERRKPRGRDRRPRQPPARHNDR